MVTTLQEQLGFASSFAFSETFSLKQRSLLGMLGLRRACYDWPPHLSTPVTESVTHILFLDKEWYITISFMAQSLRGHNYGHSEVTITSSLKYQYEAVVKRYPCNCRYVAKLY